MHTVKMLHFADVHIGMENFGRLDGESGLNSRVRDFLRRMDDMIAFAKDNQVDLTVFAGDAFKTRTPSPTLQDQFAYRVQDLAELAPVVMLVGNHDLPPADKKASSIQIYDTLRVPNVKVADSFDAFTVDTAAGKVVIGAAPYPLRQRLLREQDTAGLSIADIDDMMRLVLAQTLDALAADADALSAQHGGCPRVLTGHFTVEGAVWGSERGIMLGRDIQAPLSALADGRWDYVALGHIHKHQNLTEGRADVPPVVYSGSLDRVDFGEENELKGFCWVELRRGGAQWGFKRSKARPFLTLRADLRESADPTRALLALIDEQAEEVRDAVVRVRVQLTPETDALLDENAARDALRRAGANFIAPFQRIVDQGVRARLGDTPESLTDVELLERYLISKEVAPERRARLLTAAELIFSGDLDGEDD
jgi:exonuclease SbcD